MIGRLRISGDGGLAGVALQELGVGIRVVAIKRAGEKELEHPPRSDTILTAGDMAYIIGPHGPVLEALVQNIASSAQGENENDDEDTD